MNDAEILDLYWARNEKAIDETAQKYGPYCRTVARNILSDARDAQECLNDTWLAAWNSIPPQKPALFKAYLGKIARRISLKKWRAYSAIKRGGGEIPLALDELAECIPGGSTDAAIEEAELKELLNRFIGSLGADERRVFLRRYWYLDSIAEIAAHASFSEAKVKTMLYRTRQKLLKRLKEEGMYP